MNTKQAFNMIVYENLSFEKYVAVKYIIISIKFEKLKYNFITETHEELQIIFVLLYANNIDS